MDGYKPNFVNCPITADIVSFYFIDISCSKLMRYSSQEQITMELIDSRGVTLV